MNRDLRCDNCATSYAYEELRLITTDKNETKQFCFSCCAHYLNAFFKTRKKLLNIAQAITNPFSE